MLCRFPDYRLPGTRWPGYNPLLKPGESRCPGAHHTERPRQNVGTSGTFWNYRPRLSQVAGGTMKLRNRCARY